MNDLQRKRLVARLTELVVEDFRKVLAIEWGRTGSDEDRTIQEWGRWRDRIYYEKSLDSNFHEEDLDHLADLLAREILTVQLSRMTHEVPHVIELSHHRQQSRRTVRSGDAAGPPDLLAERSAL